MNITEGKTGRGFAIIEFEDRYGEKCSIQKSSLATENAIWFGTNDANPRVMASSIDPDATGWVKYHIPDDVLLSTRMHLTQEQVQELLPILTHFAQTGELKV